MRPTGMELWQLRERIYRLAREVLRAEGVRFTVHNEGKHLIVDGRFDYWPGTNKWGRRNQGRTRRYRFGIIKLITEVKKS